MAGAGVLVARPVAGGAAVCVCVCVCVASCVNDAVVWLFEAEVCETLAPRAHTVILTGGS